MNKKNGVKQQHGGIKEIREIIFGEVINNLQSQINELKSENKSLKDQLKLHENDISKSSSLINELTHNQNSTNNLQSKLTTQVEAIKADFEEKIKELKLTKIDKNQIGQTFIEWGMKVKQNED